jgi:hypothetical protein
MATLDWTLIVGLVVAAQNGAVTGVRLSTLEVEVGQALTLTATGRSPCGGLQIDYGDGNVLSYPIEQLPHTVTYRYQRPGTFQIRAKGVGSNCFGEPTNPQTVRVRGVPQPHPRQQPGRDSIDRAEWTDTDESFRRFDWNRDGVLTGDEVPEARRFLRSRREAQSPVGGPSGDRIRVIANRAWVDTGIDVRRGDRIRFESEGTIQLSSDPSDRGDAAGTYRVRRAPNSPLPQAPAGALIARIDNGMPMLVGASGDALRAPEAGRLFLGVNDDYMNDNEGTLLVRVIVQR